MKMRLSIVQSLDTLYGIGPLWIFTSQVKTVSGVSVISPQLPWHEKVFCPVPSSLCIDPLTCPALPFFALPCIPFSLPSYLAYTACYLSHCEYKWEQMSKFCLLQSPNQKLSTTSCFPSWGVTCLWFSSWGCPLWQNWRTVKWMASDSCKLCHT